MSSSRKYGSTKSGTIKYGRFRNARVDLSDHGSNLAGVIDKPVMAVCRGVARKKEVRVSQRLRVARRLAGRKVGHKVWRYGRAKRENLLAEATPIINYVNQQTIHVYTYTYTSLAR